ncbi:hypothetical protein C1H46_007842 [Malus baccata]|uniref:Phylloplanin n=1 Tax=Malus baccata TaxID=106549 RepID=A0A540N7Y4_MALBA|nr:hypothetical protein C1H46_007842 [Malus baccata]
MAFKATLFVFLSVAAVAIVLVPMAEAQLGLISGLLGLIRIQGTLFCTPNGNVGTGGATATPVFSNATVQLLCGTAGNVISTVTTNGSGIFSILLDPLQFLLNSLLSDCKLLVRTPLSACNSSLSGLTGLLSSPLQFIGNTIAGLLSIVNIIPVGFNLINN